jgi:hypothetical protein
MPHLTPIEPQTTAELRITVRQGGTLRDDCTAVANVYRPTGGAPVGSNQNMPLQGSGTGTYVLTWLPAWTEQTGQAVEGEYVAVITVTRAGIQRTRRFRVPVQFDD